MRWAKNKKGAGHGNNDADADDGDNGAPVPAAARTETGGGEDQETLADIMSGALSLTPEAKDPVKDGGKTACRQCSHDYVRPDGRLFQNMKFRRE